MFCLREKFSQWVCHIQIRKYFANFYVNNALHEATLDNCSHFQYVSRLRFRVIWISVKICTDEPFCHLHNRETYPYSTKDNFDRCPVIYSQITIVLPCQNILRYTIGLVHNIAYFIEPMTEAQGMTFHSLSIFCRGRVLSRYSTSHLATQASVGERRNFKKNSYAHPRSW